MKRPENWDKIKIEHMYAFDDKPSVFCGTYAKYNNGSLYGMWVDLTTFGDYDEFIEFCKMLHEDEKDPELMFQDYEGFPAAWYSESCMDEETYDKIVEYGNLDEYDRGMVDAYADCFGEYEDLRKVQEQFCGRFDSEEDYAEHIIEECYSDALPDNLKNYFDYEKFARDLFMDGYRFSNGYVFLRMVK